MENKGQVLQASGHISFISGSIHNLVNTLYVTYMVDLSTLDSGPAAG